MSESPHRAKERQSSRFQDMEEVLAALQAGATWDQAVTLVGRKAGTLLSWQTQGRHSGAKGPLADFAASVAQIRRDRSVPNKVKLRAFTPRVRDRILRGFSQGLTWKEAAIAGGIFWDTLNRWLQTGREAGASVELVDFVANVKRIQLSQDPTKLPQGRPKAPGRMSQGRVSDPRSANSAEDVASGIQSPLQRRPDRIYLQFSAALVASRNPTRGTNAIKKVL